MRQKTFAHEPSEPIARRPIFQQHHFSIPIRSPAASGDPWWLGARDIQTKDNDVFRVFDVVSGTDTPGETTLETLRV